MFKDCVISGMGVYSPYGLGSQVFADNVNLHHSGINPLTLFDNKLYEHKMAGVIDPLIIGNYVHKKYLKGTNRVAKILIEAMGNLLIDHHFKNIDNEYEVYDAENVLAFLGTYSSFQSMSEFDFYSITEPQYAISSQFPYCVTCSSLGYASIIYKIMGGCITLANGVTAGLDAIGLAAINLEFQSDKLFIAGGVEELSCQHALLMQNSARFNNEIHQIPGEGAALISMEKKDAVIKRNGPIYAELLGYSSIYVQDITQG